jgi:hypothetical protein
MGGSSDQLNQRYETSSPPGNNGGAVSGAAPCAPAAGMYRIAANDSNAHCPQKMQNELLSLTRFLQSNDS